ncbi:uncharacterized protein CMU_019960 [Cryptosporidium muris RN66]|uniref:Uncharacterized protein n=1 Tax=Cryptosporidium muris (strain RN66) TaxID=441375 RepID=B6AJB5_CRYMR|nr:uncharacterized protein CMU_019960 [Cryptosporidium muris RN66]EEA08253.1 hypothetical protein, conserved [Cryptosporidium muris RN66]|eukprot:XP_002142602.1 hypothetical protein [Cryptosporidium muris RN66]
MAWAWGKKILVYVSTYWLCCSLIGRIESTTDDMDLKIQDIDNIFSPSHYELEELSKHLDFMSIIISACGDEASKKLGGWVNKYKGLLPSWPARYIPSPKNPVTFYGCDWSICEREINLQINTKMDYIGGLKLNKLKKDDSNNFKVFVDEHKKSIDNQDTLQQLGIWWCQKALPHLITDKETVFHTIIQDFTLPDTNSTDIELTIDRVDNDISFIDDIENSTINNLINITYNKQEVSNNKNRKQRGKHKNEVIYPSGILFLKSKLLPPMNCTSLENMNNKLEIQDELRNKLDIERHRLESNLAFILQLSTILWKPQKAFTKIGRTVTSIYDLIGKTRVYTEQIRRIILNCLNSDSDYKENSSEKFELIALEVCRIQSIADAISYVVTRLLRKSRTISKEITIDAEDLLFEWVSLDKSNGFARLKDQKHIIANSIFIAERVKRMKVNGSQLIKYINAVKKLDDNLTGFK